MSKLVDGNGDLNPEIFDLLKTTKENAFKDANEAGAIQRDLERMKTEKIDTAQYNLWEEKMTTKLREAKVDGIFRFAFPSEESAQRFQDDAKFLASRINGRSPDSDITLSKDDTPEIQAIKKRKIEGIAAIGVSLGVSRGQEGFVNDADVAAIARQKSQQPDLYKASTDEFVRSLQAIEAPLPENLLDKYGTLAQAKFNRTMRIGIIGKFCEEAFEEPFEEVFPKFFATKISPDISPTAYCRTEGYSYQIKMGE